MANKTTSVFSIGDAAAHLTRVADQYFSPARVANRVQVLIERGEIPERRAGRARILFDKDLAALESEFGVTAEMVAAAEGASDA